MSGKIDQDLINPRGLSIHVVVARPDGKIVHHLKWDTFITQFLSRIMHFLPRKLFREDKYQHEHMVIYNRAAQDMKQKFFDIGKNPGVWM